MRIVGTVVANRRRDKRVSVVPIRIELEGETYTSLDWSLGGFLIEGYIGRRLPGEEVMIGIQVVAKGVEYDHVARAEIIRVDRHAGQLAANFVSLDDATLNTLEGWLTGRLRRTKRRETAG